MSFHLTAKAKADLKGIGRYTLKKWGREQRNRYLKKIDDAFHELSQDPEKGRNCDDIREGIKNGALASTSFSTAPQATGTLRLSVSCMAG